MVLAWLLCHHIFLFLSIFLALFSRCSRHSSTLMSLCLFRFTECLIPPSCICANLFPLWFLSLAPNDVNIVSNRFSFLLWFVHLLAVFNKTPFWYNPRKLAISHIGPKVSKIQLVHFGFWRFSTQMCWHIRFSVLLLLEPKNMYTKPFKAKIIVVVV